ncbi:MAG: hypothetical protein WC365_06220 [Candidatus Babeliales bacterium]|jgi:hypothetical protein
MPIENVLAKAKEAAKNAYNADWLSRAQDVARTNAPKQGEGKVFEKLPAMKLKDFALTGNPDSPAIIIVKAINNIHETPLQRDDGSFKSVFDAEVLMSSDPATPAGKYSIWMDYFVLQDELKKYAEENGDLTGKTFMICAYGKQKKIKNPKQSVYLFRVLPAPE